MESFIKDISILKKLSHQHIVKFVGSYTDDNYMGFIMSLIADCDLETFFGLAHESTDSMSMLRSFFGCLATALAYLHDSDIRHKDIKPQNILVKRDNVLFTDFGLARDSTGKSRSISVGRAGFGTPKYCAPEVAAALPRDSSSDIWSLGCVFLEMVTVVKGRTPEDMESFFDSHGSQASFVRDNRRAYQQWIDSLKGSPSKADNIPLEWADEMLQENIKSRPTAQAVADKIIDSMAKSRYRTRFCGLCCRRIAPSEPSQDVMDVDNRQETDEELAAENGFLGHVNASLHEEHFSPSQLLAAQILRNPAPAVQTTPKKEICLHPGFGRQPREQIRLELCLIREGAHPDTPKDGITPFHWAARNGSLECSMLSLKPAPLLVSGVPMAILYSCTSRLPADERQ